MFRWPLGLGYTSEKDKKVKSSTKEKVLNGILISAFVSIYIGLVWEFVWLIDGMLLSTPYPEKVFVVLTMIPAVIIALLSIAVIFYLSWNDPYM